jgi:hypothetical protein
MVEAAAGAAAAVVAGLAGPLLLGAADCGLAFVMRLAAAAPADDDDDDDDAGTT